MNLRHSLSALDAYLDAYYSRMLGRLDKAKATTGTTHKLARLIYTELRRGTDFVHQEQT